MTLCTYEAKMLPHGDTAAAATFAIVNINQMFVEEEVLLNYIQFLHD